MGYVNFDEDKVYYAIPFQTIKGWIKMCPRCFYKYNNEGKCKFCGLKIEVERYERKRQM